jgi:hypothetical protein
MSEEDEGKGADLEQEAKEQNSNLRRLIDAVGSLLSSSRELLSRLHASSHQGDADNKPPAEDKVAGLDKDKDPKSRDTRDH